MPRPVTLLGVPWDEQSSFLRGAAGGPAAIRAALASPASNSSTETGPDLQGANALGDAGDVDLPAGDPAAAVEAIAARAGALLDSGTAIIALGGDHSVTYPLVRAHAERFGPLHLLHIDAHPDLYREFEGSLYSHACPMTRILEAGLARRLVQIGIRTLNDAQRPQVARYGVEQIQMRDWAGGSLPAAFDGPVYLSVDLDALDPAFAPGVAHYEPGGLTVRDLLGIVQRFRGRLVGADIVELNPVRDREGVTAMVAAKIAREVAVRLMQGRSSPPGR